MRLRTLSAVVLVAGLFAAGVTNAQQQPSPNPAPSPGPSPLDVVPEKMPYDTPYGPPIALDRAQAAIGAAAAEASKRGWSVNIAVVDSGANLVAFARMDGAQIGSIAISEHKARVSVKARRPTRVLEDAMQRGYVFIATLDDIIASRGGIPLIEDGKLIGAIGCSGATGSQDEVVCTAGAAMINK
jgi:glc operon protein GlcG